MRYKVIGILAAAAMLTVAAAAARTENVEQERNRVHQHLTARTDTGCDCGQATLCTHLPLVVIDTGGQEIPGLPTGRDDRFGRAYYTTAEDGSPVIRADISVIDQTGQNNHPGDQPTFTSVSELRVRGNSSRHFPKLSYLLKLTDDEGESRDIPVMGMGAHHDWVLNGPILDRTLIRNYMWYNISGEIMAYAPNARFCELILNGEYMGLYLMVESITNGNDCRLALNRNADNSKLYGYLLRIDRTTEADLETVRDVYTFSERSLQIMEDIAIRYPGKSKLTEELTKEIELDYSAFEKALFSYDHDTEDYGYWNWIDTDNFVDYYLINEYCRNADAGTYSTYIYKEVGGKYRLCVWDFNNSCDNYQEEEMTPDDISLTEHAWYAMLFRDEEFAERVIQRYGELRQTYLSDGYLMAYIDEALAWLGPAIERNEARWAAETADWNPLLPEERNLQSHEEAVEQLKNWLHERGKWMDEHIDVLRHFAHPSRNKVYNH